MKMNATITIMTKMIAKNGMNNDTSDMTTAMTPSKIEMKMFPLPPVVIVLTFFSELVVSWEIVAVPPPAMMAMPQVKNGSISPMNDAVSKIPAMVATGVESVFYSESTTGM